MSWKYFLSKKSIPPPEDQPNGLDPYEDELEINEMPKILYYIMYAICWLLGNRR
jgi:hypothetical protein